MTGRHASSRLRQRVRELRHDSRAQDLVEYGLLTALVGLCCIAAWGLIENQLGTRYSTLNNQNQGLWIPPDPGGAGS